MQPKLDDLAARLDDPALARHGRHLTADLLLQIGEASWLLSLHDGRLAVNGGEEPFDTQTPIVVYPSPQPSTTSSRSDRASAGRDNVLPGEDVLYDG